MSNLVINANSIYDRVIRIGRQTENLVSAITFNVQMWIEEYGLGECVLNVKRNGDGSAYPVPMTITDGLTTWTITDTDTAKKGRGEIQLFYTVGEKVKTSPIFTISCGESLVGGEAPEPYEEWLTELNRMTAEVEAAKTSASASAQTAQTAAGTAAAKATEAEQSANTASGFAVNASASATSASTSAQAAAQSAQQAASSVSDVEASAQAASQSAQSAEAAKTAAQTAEASAQGFAQTASEKASQAAESAANAAESVTDAQAEVTRASAEADRARAEAEQAASRIYDFLPADSASGAVASFTDGADNVPLKSLVVSITGTQGGSGNPSPTNVRPITGWTGCNLTVNETEVPISWEIEVGTVYTGSLDVQTGLLTVTHKVIDLGSLTWSTSASSGRHTAPCPSDFIIVANNVLMSAICSNYMVIIGNNVSRIDMSIGMINLGSLLINDSNLSHATPADFTAAMTGVQLAYEIEPVTYQLTPHEVKSLLGQNNIYADTGDVSVEYRADIQRYIEKKLGV